MIIKGYKTESLAPEMLEMLKQLSQTLIHINFFDCEFDVKILCDILRELPLLQSIELSMKLTMDAKMIMNATNLPQLLHLKVFKMEINDNMAKNILEITKSANIEILTLFNAFF